MGDGSGVAPRITPIGALSDSVSNRSSTLGAQRRDPMAGFVVDAHQTQESVDQLSSQTEFSPCHYADHKGGAGAAECTAAANGGLLTDVETDAATGTLPARTGSIDGVKRAAPGCEDPRPRGANGAVPMPSAVPGKSNGANGNRAFRDALAWSNGRMPRQPERLAARQNRGRETHASTKAHRSLVGPRLYGGIYGAVPTHSHFEKAMRGSAHRVVSATTRFDSVTAGALSLLADAARQYLMRIGDSSKARADLAGRTDPNIYDVLGAGESGPCIDLDPLRRWADGWKGEVGDIMPSAPQPAIEHAMVAHGHGFGDIAGESPVDHTMAEQNGDAVGLGGDAADEDDIDAIINGLGLSCLLLDGPGIGGEFEGPIPPHLPQMARLTDHGDGESPGTYGNGGVASPVPPSPESLVPEKASVVAAAGASSGDAGYSGEPAGLGSDNEEETAESMAAHILHLVSSSLSALNPSIAAGGALSSFFRPAAKADPTCDLDNIIPSFDIPESGFVPAPEYIQRRLAQAEKLEPGAPIFLSSSSPQRDTLGDTEEQWRQAKHRLHAGIYNVAAERAVEEMDDAPVPVRRRRVSDASEKESRPWQLAVGDKAKTAEPNDEMEVDINIDEDVMDIDLDLDIMGGPSDHRAEADDQEVHDVFARELHAAAEQCVAAAPERPAPEDVPEAALEAEPEPIVLPVSNGLRGSGKPHWSGEWFSAAMRKRLSRITAQDIVPCDSLFLSSPSASHRHVLDEVARAFVDSEGGGHLHETTTLEGFGPSANTYTVPSASGSALRWTLHHIMQTRGVKTVDSLYAGRSSLAGGVAGHGVGQYVSRMCSLVKGSAEEEADLVVSGAVRAAGDRDGDQWSNRKINPTQLDLMEQLVAGVEKRVPWAQERLDIHVLESRIVDRQPVVAATRLAPLMGSSVAPATPPVAPATPSAAPVTPPVAPATPPAAPTTPPVAPATPSAAPAMPSVTPATPSAAPATPPVAPATPPAAPATPPVAPVTPPAAPATPPVAPATPSAAPTTPPAAPPAALTTPPVAPALSPPPTPPPKSADSNVGGQDL